MRPVSARGENIEARLTTFLSLFRVPATTISRLLASWIITSRMTNVRALTSAIEIEDIDL